MKSLTKSENGSLGSMRMGSNEDSKFLNLFQLLDKMNRYDEKVILKKGYNQTAIVEFKGSPVQADIDQLEGMNPVHKISRIQIREQLDFATILYQKGLYKQSLKVLERLKF